MVNLSLMAFRFAIYVIHHAALVQVIPITALLVTPTPTGICSTTDASFPVPTVIPGIMSPIYASYVSSTLIATWEPVSTSVPPCIKQAMTIALVFT